MMGLAMAMGGTAFGAATYDAETTPGTLVVDVDAAGATLDAARVVAGIVNIVKTGPGRLTATPLASYTGDFTINAGEFLVTDAGHLGANGTGTVYVNDGASLADGCTTKGWLDTLVTGKTIVFTGAPAAGKPGKFYRTVANGKSWTAHSSTFRFDSDATVAIDKDRVKWHGTIDLGGHTLTVDGLNKWAPGQFDCQVENGGTILVRGGTTDAWFMNEAAVFKFLPSENPRALTVMNARYEANAGIEANGATLNLVNGRFGTAKHRPRTLTPVYTWKGPVNLSQNSAIAYSTGLTNTVGVSGNIAGTGTLTIGPGWLNLSGATENTYSGAVTVRAATNGKIAPEHSGVALLDNSPFFPAASSVTFRDGANLELCADYSAPLPKLTFAGGGTSRVSGPVRGDLSAPRTSMAGLEKTGAGTLELCAPMRVTGRANVASGVLRLKSKIYGRAGLWEWVCADMSKGWSAGGQNCWCTVGDFTNGYMRTNQVNAVYSCLGPAKIFSGYASIVSNNITRATGVIYKGYLWNRSAAPVTWQIGVHMTYRMRVFLNGVDRGPSAPRGETENAAANVITATLQPGPNALVLYSLSANWKARQDVSPRFDGLGLSYDPNPVAGQTNVAHFVKLDDGGTGRLFTIDADDSPAAAAELLPLFDDLAFAPGTTFDLNGNSFTQGNLSGCPTVANGDLTLTGAWTLAAADLLAGAKLSVAGTLAFGPEATVTSLDAAPLRAPGVRELEIATAAAVTGAPTLDAAAPALKGWRVKTTPTSVLLVRDSGSVLIVR